MAGISDAPFRRLCRRFGAGMTTSEMTTADISLWQTEKSRRRLDLDMDAEPRVVQIAGSDPAQLALAATLCVDRGAQIIDINMGCPAKKVCKTAAGSALLRDPDLVTRILTSVIAAVAVPVTLKIGPGGTEITGTASKSHRSPRTQESRHWPFTGALAHADITAMQNMKRLRRSSPLFLFRLLPMATSQLRRSRLKFFA